jgi:hypothetical protein
MNMPRHEAPEASGYHGPPKAGGWGKGQLATAGTLMLGSAAAVPKDGVFDDDDEGDLAGMAASGKAWQRGQGGSVGVSATASQVELPGAAVAVAGAEQDELGFEDVDEDALHAGSAAGTAGIADDLAAKLAQFEAMVDEDA